MPQGNLPPRAKKIFEAAEASAKTGTCKSSSDKEACAAKVGWSAVKEKFKKVGDKWTPKSELKEFSLVITKAVFNKESQEMKWRAVASDTDEDNYSDEMSLELFSDFLGRIKTKESPPKQFCSEYWAGGIPYISVSHYPDMEGKGIPGDVEDVFIDGNRLKAAGTFSNTPLGKACFDAICSDLYGEKSEIDDKVRISIAFLDWKHRHKSDNTVFERSGTGDSCPQCFKELLMQITDDEYEAEGKQFLGGHLIHLAMTRIPVNKRTEMEVDRSMATQLQDATSIVGEELAEELEENLEALTNPTKSEALVTMSEDETVEKGKKPSDEEDDEDESGDDEKKRKKKQHKKSEVSVDLSEVFARLDKLTSLLPEKEEKSEDTHVLDEALSNLKAVYDEICESEDPQAEMVKIQEPFNQLGEIVRAGVDKAETRDIPAGEVNASAIAKAIKTELEPLVRQMELLQAQMQNAPAQPDNIVPSPINIPPYLASKPQKKKSDTPGLRAIVERSLENTGGM